MCLLVRCTPRQLQVLFLPSWRGGDAPGTTMDRAPSATSCRLFFIFRDISALGDDCRMRSERAFSRLVRAIVDCGRD
jgi:hypothetical protein